MPDPSRADSYLFLGTHGHVIAVDQHDGSTVWDTSLPKTGWGVVVMLVEDGRLLCGSAGRAFALDPVDGRILWENALPGMGQGIVGMCTTRQAAGLTAAAAAQVAAEQARQTGTGHGS